MPLESLENIFHNKKPTKKAPAYKWQDLALQIINELSVPSNKKSSVFKACRDNPESRIKTALNDTKELCKGGTKWQYFFKVLSSLKQKELENKENKEKEKKKKNKE
jgi:hypothetical protein